MRSLNNNHLPIILFDIDYTLFDTEIFRKKLYKNISKAANEDQEEIEKVGQTIYEELHNMYGYFNPVDFIKKFKNRLKSNVDFTAIEKSIWDEETFCTSFYKEVDRVLHVVKKVAQIGIFSKGHDRFQRAKLKTISHFLEKKHIHIVVDKHTSLPELIEKYRKHQLYLVDDALDVLYSASKLREDIYTIWVKRGRYAQNQKDIPGFKADAIIKSLTEIILIVGQN